MDGSVATLLVGLITAGSSILAVILTNSASNKKIEQQLISHQNVTDVKIDELTREVRMHNNFAQRIPVLENDVEHLKFTIQDLKDK